MIKNLLSIAGSDPSGGAGVQADLKTFSALGAYGMSVITALTAQNTEGVRGVHTPAPDFIQAQLEAIQDDIRIDGVKIGMIANVAALEVITAFLGGLKGIPVVLDPVMVAQSGDVLVEPAVISMMKDTLFPLVTVITPNMPEAQVLTGQSDATFSDIEHALKALKAPAILLKGGHEESADIMRDALIEGDDVTYFEAPRVETTNNHGTGCTLSSAIAVYLAQGEELRSAAQKAKTYITDALKQADSLEVGQGAGPVHHFHTLWEEK